MDDQNILIIRICIPKLYCNRNTLSVQVTVALNSLVVVMTVDDEFSDAACAKDNRELMDSRENQLLSKDEIHSLRLQGVTGEASYSCLWFIQILHYHVSLVTET